MRRFYAYIRVSTQRQGVHGVSLKEQRDIIRRYAERNGLEVAEWFEERETAAKRGRRRFTQMLAALKKGMAEGVLIHKVDRGARNLRDWADLGDLIDRGIEIHFVSEGLDLTSRGGRLSADIQAVVAADYIRNLKEEIRKGFYGRLRQGYYPLPAPVGYLNRGGGRAKEPDPRTAPLVRKAFELYGSGHYSLETLRHDLARRGLSRCGGKPYSKEGLANLLRNPFYCGIIRLRRTHETFDGSHPPIVSSTLYERVQQIMSGVAPRSRRTRRSFLFQRLLTCGPCGRTLVGELQKGHVYYRCHARSCPVTGIREDRVDQTLCDALGIMELDTTEADELKRVFEGQLKERDQVRQGEREALAESLAKVESRLARLTDAYIDELIDKETFEDRRTQLVFARRRLQETSAEDTFNAENARARFDRFLGEAASIASNFKEGPPEDRRELLARISSNRAFDGSTIAVSWRTPFYELSMRAYASNWCKVQSSNHMPPREEAAVEPYYMTHPPQMAGCVSSGGARPAVPRTVRMCQVGTQCFAEMARVIAEHFLAADAQVPKVP